MLILNKYHLPLGIKTQFVLIFHTTTNNLEKPSDLLNSVKTIIKNFVKPAQMFLNYSEETLLQIILNHTTLQKFQKREILYKIIM